MVDTASKGSSDWLVHDPDGGMDRLLEIMARLRDPATGCPWDIEQTFATIAPYTIEEAHEVADVIERQAWSELPGELGDLLFQAVYHAQMAKDAGLFDFQTVVKTISDKMVARHPHVFGNESRDKSAAQQTADWENIKAAERGAGRGGGAREGGAGEGGARVLDGVAMGLPALTRAVKLQNRAARVGFDWPSTDEVLAKLAEEMAELVEARETLGQAEIVEEMGDMLFVMANLCRHMKIDPEAALRGANAKFIRRFNRIEDWLAETGRAPAGSNLAEMDALWNRAKAEEKARKAGAKKS